MANETGMVNADQLKGAMPTMNPDQLNEIASNVNGAIASVTSGAIANTENISNTTAYTNYLAQSSAYVGQTQYNQPKSQDSVNNLINSGMNTAVQANIDLLKLKGQQADFMINAGLDAIKIYTQDQQHQEEMDLAQDNLDLAEEEFAFDKEKFDEKQKMKQAEMDEDARQFDETMKYNYDKLAAQEEQKAAQEAAAAQAKAQAEAEAKYNYDLLKGGVSGQSATPQGEQPVFDAKAPYAPVYNQATGQFVVYDEKGSMTVIGQGDEGYGALSNEFAQHPENFDIQGEAPGGHSATGARTDNNQDIYEERLSVGSNFGRG